MSQLVGLLQEADLALIEMENAKSALESAKLTLDLAKEELDRSRTAFEEVISRADEIGVPRAKLRKLAEERAAALLASGLFSQPINKQAPATKMPRPAKAKIPKEKKTDEDFGAPNSPPEKDGAELTL